MKEGEGAREGCGLMQCKCWRRVQVLEQGRQLGEGGDGWGKVRCLTEQQLGCVCKSYCMAQDLGAGATVGAVLQHNSWVQEQQRTAQQLPARLHLVPSHLADCHRLWATHKGYCAVQCRLLGAAGPGTM